MIFAVNLMNTLPLLIDIGTAEKAAMVACLEMAEMSNTIARLCYAGIAGRYGFCLAVKIDLQCKRRRVEYRPAVIAQT
jgi:hypothetical protein